MSQLGLFDAAAPAAPALAIPEKPTAAAPVRVAKEDVVRSGCVISADELYRYTLPRLGLLRGPSKGRVLWVLVNPSTADGEVDDNTAKRVMGFSADFGFADSMIVNMFAWRDTEPTEMIVKGEAGHDLIGPENDATIVREAALADLIIVGWGSIFSKVVRYLPKYKDRDRDVLRLLAGREVYCLGKTKDGRPRHPLMLAATTALEPYALAV